MDYDYKKVLEEKVEVRVHNYIRIADTTPKFDKDLVNEITEDIYLKTNDLLDSYINLKVRKVLNDLDKYKRTNLETCERVNDNIYNFIKEDW